MMLRFSRLLQNLVSFVLCFFGTAQRIDWKGQK